MKLDFTFVPFPREIWDKQLDLSQAEFRLLGWFCYDLKFGVQKHDFNDDHILRGTTVDGRQYPPVGLSRNSMQRARALLIEKQLLNASQVSGGGGRGKTATWTYSLNLSDSERNTDKPLRDGEYTSQTLTINLSDSDNVIRNIERTEEAEVNQNLVLVGEVQPKSKQQKTFILPGWVPRENWDAFVEMRKKSRKPMTDHAMDLAVRDLQKLQLQGYDPVQVLDRSTLNNWAGLYPVQENGNGRPQNRAEQRQQRNREILIASVANRSMRS